MQERRATLDTQLKDVARELREAQATLHAKSQARAAYDELFGGAATTLTGRLDSRRVSRGRSPRSVMLAFRL